MVGYDKIFAGEGGGGIFNRRSAMFQKKEGLTRTSWEKSRDKYLPMDKFYSNLEVTSHILSEASNIFTNFGKRF